MGILKAEEWKPSTKMLHGEPLLFSTANSWLCHTPDPIRHTLYAVTAGRGQADPEQSFWRYST